MKHHFYLLLIVVFMSTLQAQTIALNSGWNLIGLNQELTLLELEAQMEVDNLNIIQGESTIFNRSYVENNLTYLNDFIKFEMGKGYWINVNHSVTLTFEPKTLYGLQTTRLKEGWNLISPLQPLSLEEIKNQLGEEQILVIQNGSKTYQKAYVDKNLSFLNDFTAFELGAGYWVKVASDVNLANHFIEESFLDSIFTQFNVGSGGSNAFDFSSTLSTTPIWLNSIDLIMDSNIENNDYYKNITNFNGTAFDKLQQYLVNGKFIMLWMTKNWKESWFSIFKIQEAMDEGYIPVFIYWYFGDELFDSMPTAEEIDAYSVNNQKLADFLKQLNGKKFLIMEPEFNGNTALSFDENQVEFASILSKAIDIVKQENNNTFFSLCMTDLGRRGVNIIQSDCGYEHCALGDQHTWAKSDLIYETLSDQIDFVSFQEMVGEFSRDPFNSGGWSTPNPKAYTNEEIGIDYLAQRISNFSAFLNDRYQKPVFLPYMTIPTATWQDTNQNNVIENSEINSSGWNDKAEQTYKNLSEMKEELQNNGLFGFAPMALFDDPKHDLGGYQYFMQNEYHFGIIETSAVGGVDSYYNGDITFKGKILEYIYTK